MDLMPEFRAAITGVGRHDGLDEAYIEQLVSLDELAYARERNRAAKALGVSVTALDRAVRAARKQAENRRRGWTPRRAEPCAYAVDPAAVLDEVAQMAERYLHLPPHGEVVLALWVLHSYCFDAQPHTPRLAITSATRGCGKTVVLGFLSLVCQAPLISDNATAAAIFRLVEEHKPTLLLDELDGRFQEADDLRRILNSGWQRGGMAHRVEDIGGRREVVSYATHAPAALAAIGRLPSTLEDRAIALRMERARPGEVKARLRTDRPEDWASLRERLARAAQDIYDRIASADPEMPGVHNRAADKWRILVAIADAAGGRWPEAARAAMQAEVAASQAEDDTDVGVLLLSDLREAFGNEEQLSSAEAIDALTEMEGRPWAEYRHGKPITPHALARLLGRFGIRSRQMWKEGANTRGYARADFEPVWERYLHTTHPQSARVLDARDSAGFSAIQSARADNTPHPQSARVLDARDSAGFSAIQSARAGNREFQSARPKAKDSAGSSTLALSKGGIRGEGRCARDKEAFADGITAPAARRVWEALQEVREGAVWQVAARAGLYDRPQDCVPILAELIEGGRARLVSDGPLSVDSIVAAAPLTLEEQEAFDERAATAEFEGGLTRAEAEALARAEVSNEHNEQTAENQEWTRR